MQNNSISIMSIDNFSMSSVLPYKIAKRINKTGEGRSGLEIYKRRNSRKYRVILQYITFKSLLNATITPNILNEFREGFTVLISPAEYFGNNYPNRSEHLLSSFIVGKTGFLYYSNPDEYAKYKPLENWNEVYELDTKGKAENDDTWVGEYVLNVKNAKPQKISPICKDKTKTEKQDVSEYLNSHYGNKKYPEQCGLGNYDYDYANESMILNIKKQMLYLMLKSIESDGTTFCDYIIQNYDKIKDDEKKDKQFIKSINEGSFKSKYNSFFSKLEEDCKNLGLLDFDKLYKLGVWNREKNLPICPLCGKEIHPHEFFEGIEQMEGRRVSDNTQRSIVLMHINALRPGKLNHRTYNLGWGHNFCNLIQGDKDISETINQLQDIVSNYNKHI